MRYQQDNENRIGVTVFGSALMLVEPDLVVLNFKAVALKSNPKEAFQEASSIAVKIADFLGKAGIKEVSTSETGLSQTNRRQSSGEYIFLGYTAKITFKVVLRDISLLESILSGIVDCGSSEIDSVDYQTSQLRELRQESRKKTIVAAREKAEIYCEAAGVQLGKVTRIIDQNPEYLGRSGHMMPETPIDDVTGNAFTAGTIPVGAAIYVDFDFLD